ncbi:HpcH/HpaI aldolase/citrate lyase family protein [Sphingomonas astaxanthinifaciens]|uniref:CoA ester lyase n=1 Tax=Sphingomonas astaxanthinifaciens DSM 22298 TaxID=1123267 RepID=A0ABQ5Z2X0_9SPHN|nr:CoA ester lyase [Sphingomonas astaxanthinifaciens]GLR46427.1 CoA ester lyase [Sphingomonas astaxanthinifaciens DSM 22298]
MTAGLFGRPAVLFLPANRASAVARARESGADLVILDLEDAVAPADKEVARAAAVAAVAEPWPCPVAIRINGVGSRWHVGDLEALRDVRCDLVVVPRVERREAIEEVKVIDHLPVAAMIETAKGVLAASDIASRAAALIAGTNDLRASLRLPDGTNRAPLQLALQTIVLAARANGIPCFDGVFNKLDDPEGLAAEAAEGRALGFDGKTLIHPGQIAAAKAAWTPTPQELARAERLVAAASGGAQRFEGEMIERMHVEAAERLLASR